MKKIVKATITLFVIAFASAAMANPKCSHRLAFSTNDLLKNTNPVKEKVAKVDVRTGQSKAAKGKR